MGTEAKTDPSPRSQKPKLLFLVVDMQDFDATDPLDHIYAVTGMAQQTRPGIESMPIDYTISSEDANHTLMKYHLTQCNLPDPFKTWHLDDLYVHKDGISPCTDWALRPAETGRNTDFVRVMYVGGCHMIFGWVELFYASSQSTFILLIRTPNHSFDLMPTYGSCRVIDIFQTTYQHALNIDAAIDLFECCDSSKKVDGLFVLSALMPFEVDKGFTEFYDGRMRLWNFLCRAPQWWTYWQESLTLSLVTNGRSSEPEEHGTDEAHATSESGQTPVITC